MISFFKKLFSGKWRKRTKRPKFSKPRPGDYFFTFDRYQFTPFRLLVHDKEAGIYHLSIFEGEVRLPSDPSVLTVHALHVPVPSVAFNKVVVFARVPLKEEDFTAYYEYLRQTNFRNYTLATKKDSQALMAEATGFYREGYALAENGLHEASIAAYSRALDIAPTYLLYEAWDNRALSRMQLGDYETALKELKHATNLDPHNYVAAYALGECYFHLNRLKEAREVFSYILKVDPGHQEAAAKLKMLS